MDISLIYIFITFIFSTLFSVYCLPLLFKSRNDELKTPPGSTGLPFVGETLAFFSLCKKGMPEKFAIDRTKKYSSTVIKTSLFGEKMAVFYGPAANKFIFANESKFLKGWKPGPTTLLFGDPESEEVGTKYRKLFAPYLSPETLQKIVPLMDATTKQHLNKFWEGRDNVTVLSLAKSYTTTTVARLFLGIEDEELMGRLVKLLPTVVKGLFTIPVNIPGTSFHGAIRAKAELQKEIEGWVKKWKSDFAEGKLSASQTMLVHMLKDALDEEDISTKALALIVASYHTTSSVIACVILCLAKYPDIYHKVLAEQREITASKAPGDILNWADVQKMKYLRNVVRESQRIYAIFGTYKEAITDFTYNGFLIPKGWKVHTTTAIQKDPDYFKNPEQFDPSRFEGDGPLPYSYAPFGLGARICPGMEYARIKIQVFMHNFITKFKWEQEIPDEKIIYDPIPRPEKGLPIHLYPHKAI